MSFSLSNRFFIPFCAAEHSRIEQTAPPPVKEEPDLKEIFCTHGLRIFKLCRQVTKEFETAENMTIEVFVRFYEEFDRLPAGAKIAEQLRRLAVKELLKYQQQKAFTRLENADI